MRLCSSPRIPRGAYGRRKEVRCFHEHRPTPPPRRALPPTSARTVVRYLPARPPPPRLLHPPPARAYARGAWGRGGGARGCCAADCRAPPPRAPAPRPFLPLPRAPASHALPAPPPPRASLLPPRTSRRTGRVGARRWGEGLLHRCLTRTSSACSRASPLPPKFPRTCGP